MIALALLTAVGCATSRPQSSKAAPEDETLPLAEIAAGIAEQGSGPLVLMNGIQDHLLPVPKAGKGKFADTVSQLAAAGGYTVFTAPDFFFLYPPGYEALLGVSFAGKLDPAYAKMRLPLTLGFDTPVYAALALIAHALDITIVADNVVAAAKCGAIALDEAPLQTALEALLMSARISGDAFTVESTPNYIFIYAQQNQTHGPVVLNAESLTPEQNALLDTPVKVMLAHSEDGKKLEVSYGARRLRAVLPMLSEQFKIPVTASPELAEMPVNPVVMNNVTVRQAMELLIRQWPMPWYGYRMIGNEIRIERITAGNQTSSG